MEALREAAKGVLICPPNPAVGAVAVVNDTIIARDWHRGAGHEHAEILVLKKIPPQTPNVTLYVTLEPCNHWGRTPPCVNAIIQHGISRVVYAFSDPNPIVKHNNTESILREKNIEVIYLPLSEVDAFYQDYTIQVQNKIRFLHAVSLVGIDTQTDVKELLKLFNRFPYLEFGVCFDEPQNQDSRYSGYRLQNILRQYPNLPWVAHLSFRNFIHSLKNMDHLKHINWKRIQFNLSDYMIIDNSISALIDTIKRLCIDIEFDKNIILKENHRTRNDYKKLNIPAFVDLLSDVSCGKGLKPSIENDWPFAYHENFGFAGGIGIDNISENIAKIRAKVPISANFTWIDMESSLRDKETNYFDLAKAWQIADLTESFIVQYC
jgi:pyrimidine deaminase RibD-like protein